MRLKQVALTGMLCTAFLATGCETATGRGALIGGGAGGVIGGLAGGPRGAVVGAATGAVLGGAVGNAIDRLAHDGAVVDFIRLHVTTATFSHDWYVFTLADAAIVAGVAGLLYESVRPDRAAKVP